MTFEIGQTVEVFSDLGTITGKIIVSPDVTQYLVLIEGDTAPKVFKENFISAHTIPKN